MNLRMSSRAARKNTSSPSSMTVSPSGIDAAAAAIDSDDARLGVRHDARLSVAQLLADQQSALARADAHQAHAAVGEIQHLQRAGIA